MGQHIHQNYQSLHSELDSSIEHFEELGTIIQKSRNTIKKITVTDKVLNVKSYKVPNAFNKLAYRYIRKSKARRSFEYAEKLLSIGINTPAPVAYYEEFGLSGLKKSYYICEQLDDAFTLREFLEQPQCCDQKTVMEQFVAFSFDLHHKGVEFLDNTTGNTLIRSIGNGKYEFYLVDINRMKFHSSPMHFSSRMKNLSLLSNNRKIMHTISKQYAAVYKKSEDEIFKTMLCFSNLYQKRRDLKRSMKYVFKLKFLIGA